LSLPFLQVIVIEDETLSSFGNCSLPVMPFLHHPSPPAQHDIPPLKRNPNQQNKTLSFIPPKEFITIDDDSRCNDISLYDAAVCHEVRASSPLLNPPHNISDSSSSVDLIIIDDDIHSPFENELPDIPQVTAQEPPLTKLGVSPPKKSRKGHENNDMQPMQRKSSSTEQTSVSSMTCTIAESFPAPVRKPRVTTISSYFKPVKNLTSPMSECPAECSVLKPSDSAPTGTSIQRDAPSSDICLQQADPKSESPHPTKSDDNQQPENSSAGYKPLGDVNSKISNNSQHSLPSLVSELKRVLLYVNVKPCWTWFYLK
jgi:hypothetical protein